MSALTLPYADTESADVDITTAGTSYSLGATLTPQALATGVIVRLLITGTVNSQFTSIEVQTAPAGVSSGDASSWLTTSTYLATTETTEDTFRIPVVSPVFEQVRLRYVCSAITGGGTISFQATWASTNSITAG